MKLATTPFGVLILLLAISSCNKSSQTLDPKVNVITLAGSTQGFADGARDSAKFYSPTGICVDMQGNVYVADMSNYRIRKITPDGGVSTFAGSVKGFADGKGSAARFDNPIGVCADAQGNIYVTDMLNHKIRKITPDGTVSTLAGSVAGVMDGTGSAAKFYYPVGIGIDAQGNLYVAEEMSHMIRKVTQAGVVTTIAGSIGGSLDGSGTTARFNNPTGISPDGSGNIYVIDYSGHSLRKITPDGMVSTLAGSAEGFADGTGKDALFHNPFGLCTDKQGNIYVADMGNQKIRKITPSGVVSTFAGSTAGSVDGPLSTAQFSSPVGITVDAKGNFYIVDKGNENIRKIVMAD